MIKTNSGTETRTLYVGDTEVEVWEHPEVRFGVTPADLRRYFEQGHWVALFNAMTLADTHG